MRKQITKYIPNFLKPVAYEIKYWSIDRKSQRLEFEGIVDLQKKWKKIIENSLKLISDK